MITQEELSKPLSGFDTQPAYDSDINDISLDIFKLSYLPAAIDKETLLENGRDIKQQLSSLKVYDPRADVPTNAGILLFGKHPRFFLSGAFVQYVRFTGTDEVSDFDYEYRFEGDLTTQMKVMDELLNRRLLKGYSINLAKNINLLIRHLLYRNCCIMPSFTAIINQMPPLSFMSLVTG